MFNKQRNFYEILNASPNASFQELKSNYKHLILQCHPDKLLQQQQQQKQQQQKHVQHENADKLENDLNNQQQEFVGITEAWNCLKDPLKRKRYDAELLLNKFHTHSNIYAHIQLKEMKKCLSTDVELELVRNDEEQGMESDNSATESPSLYIYTYDCRCGGQYIVDESAEQYCRKVNNSIAVAAAGGGDGGGGDGGGVDDDAENSQNNNSPTNKTDNAAVVADVNRSVGGGGGISIVGTGSVEGVVFTEDEEGGDSDGELIVECSECSLVIILNG